VFQHILGPSHTTKQHRLSVHKLDELCMKGNLHDGISAYNVALHKHEKAAFTLTNHEWGQFVERLIIVAIPYHATWGLTRAVFRLVPVRLKWLYWAIFDPACPQCLHYQYRWHIRILEQQYAASTVLTLFNDMSGSRPPPPHSSNWGHHRTW